MGFIIWGLPPRSWLQPYLLIPAALVALLPLVSFLPATSFLTPPWRLALTRDLLIPLPDTFTPQPWLTLESWLTLMTGLVWLVYVTAQPLSSASRWGVARFYVTGVTLLAALAIGMALAGHALPFWHARQHFGFFPNRNQMGDWLALGSLLVPALIYQDWDRNRPLSIWWIMALGILGTALVMTYSRAGIAIFFGGTGLFLMWVAAIRRWTANFIIGVVVIVLMFTGFFIFGGKTLARFQQTTIEERSKEAPADRMDIQQDALAMKAVSPWNGVGLGNFSALFPFYRVKSANESRAIHPESDWVWFVAEAGWWTAAAVAVGLLILFYDAFPLERGTSRALRMASTIGVLAFAVHGCIDVSAHRLGAFVPACFLAWLMIHPRHNTSAPPWWRGLFRFTGIVMMGLGACWIWATFSPRWIPSSAGVEKAKYRSDVLIKAGNNPEAIKVIDQALSWAPLDWELYYRRGVARVYTEPDIARMDFLRARTLEPLSSLVPLQEGILWLPIRPTYAVSAWGEALRRNLHNPHEYYMDMLQRATGQPVVLDGLRQLGLNRPQLLLIYAGKLGPEDFQVLRQQLLLQDPRLTAFSAPEKQNFFGLWVRAEGLSAFVTAVQQVPEWKEEAWFYLAQDLAQRGEFSSAYLLAHSKIEEPQFPQINNRDTLEVLEQRAQLRPDDFATAYLLIRGYLIAKRATEAYNRATIVTKQKDCPDYFHYLRAGIAASQNLWPDAWNELQQYQLMQ